MTAISTNQKGSKENDQETSVLPKPIPKAPSSWQEPNKSSQRSRRQSNSGMISSHRSSAVLHSILPSPRRDASAAAYRRASHNNNNNTNDKSKGSLSKSEAPTTTIYSRRSEKSFLYTMLNPRSHQWPAVWFKRCIATVILVDFILFVASTEPQIQQLELSLFDTSEAIVATIYLMEYLARIVTVTESHKYAVLGPFAGRIRYATSVRAVIDLASCLPYFIEQASGVDFLPQLTILRTLRLLRILKTNGFVRAIEAVWRVIFYNREILVVALFVGLFLIMVTSLLMYVFRPHDSEGKTCVLFLALVSNG
jgi:hypothetical protein